jgi:hypothetical protein
MNIHKTRREETTLAEDVNITERMNENANFTKLAQYKNRRRDVSVWRQASGLHINLEHLDQLDAYQLFNNDDLPWSITYSCIIHEMSESVIIFVASSLPT